MHFKSSLSLRASITATAVTVMLASSAPVLAQSSDDEELSPEVQAKSDKLNAWRDNLDEFLPTVNVVDADSLPVTFPYREVQEHVVVDVDFGDGKLLPFMLDTGAPTYVTPELAKAFGGEVIVETAGLAGGGKIVWAPLLLMSDITLAGVLPVGRPTGEIGWSSSGAFYCITPHGLIGAPLMSNAVWQIHYGKKEITVAASVDQLDNIEGAIAVPFAVKEKTHSPTPHIQLGVGDSMLTFVVDTGGGIPLTINTADLAAASVTLPEDAPKSANLAGGAGGAFEMNLAVTRIPVRFGDRELLVPVTVGDGMAPGANGNVGHTFLKNFVATFDWSTQTLYLDPLFEGDSVPSISAPAGAAIGLQGDKIAVTSIPQGGAADLAGLTLGEEVAAVDGKDVSNITPDDYCALVENPYSELTTASGKTYDVAPIEGFYDGNQ